MRLVDPPDDRPGEEQDAGSGSYPRKRDPERGHEENKVQRREGDCRRHAESIRDPYAGCGKQRIEPEVKEHAAAADVGDGRAPDVPVRERWIEPGEFRLDVWDITGPESRTAKGRKLDRLGEILPAVSDQPVRRSRDQADGDSACKDHHPRSPHFLLTLSHSGFITRRRTRAGTGWWQPAAHPSARRQRLPPVAPDSTGMSG